MLMRLGFQAGFEPDLPDIDDLDVEDVEEEEESVKIVRLVKRDEPLGATIKADNGTRLVQDGTPPLPTPFTGLQIYSLNLCYPWQLGHPWPPSALVYPLLN